MDAANNSNGMNEQASSEVNPSPISELTPPFIDAIHTYYPNLTSLNLSNHQIKVLPIELRELSSLVALDLSYNQINDIDKVVEVLQLLPKLQRLHLHHNPIAYNNSNNNHDKSYPQYIVSQLPSLIHLDGQRVRQNHCDDASVTDDETENENEVNMRNNMNGDGMHDTDTLDLSGDYSSLTSSYVDSLIGESIGGSGSHDDDNHQIPENTLDRYYNRAVTSASAGTQPNSSSRNNHEPRDRDSDNQYNTTPSKGQEESSVLRNNKSKDDGEQRLAGTSTLQQRNAFGAMLAAAGYGDTIRDVHQAAEPTNPAQNTTDDQQTDVERKVESIEVHQTQPAAKSTTEDYKTPSFKPTWLQSTTSDHSIKDEITQQHQKLQSSLPAASDARCSSNASHISDSSSVNEASSSNDNRNHNGKRNDADKEQEYDNANLGTTSMPAMLSLASTASDINGDNKASKPMVDPMGSETYQQMHSALVHDDKRALSHQHSNARGSSKRMNGNMDDERSTNADGRDSEGAENLMEALKRNELLSEQMHASERKVAELQQQLQTLQQTHIEHLQQLSTHSDNALHSLQEALSRTKSDVSKFESLLKDSKAEVDKQNTVTNEQREEINVLKEQLTAQQTEKQHYQHEIQTLSNHLDELQLQFDTRNSEFHELQQKFNNLQLLAKTEEDNAHHLRNSANEMRQEIHTLKLELENQSAWKLKEAEKHKLEIENLSAIHRDEINLLKAQLEQQQQEHQSQVLSLQRQLDERDSNIQRLESELQQQISTQHKSLDTSSKQEELQHSQLRISQLENELKQLRTYYSTSRSPHNGSHPHYDKRTQSDVLLPQATASSSLSTATPTPASSWNTHNHQRAFSTLSLSRNENELKVSNEKIASLTTENTLLRQQLDSLKSVIDLQHENLNTQFPSAEHAILQWKQQITTLFIQLKSTIDEYKKSKVLWQNQLQQVENKLHESQRNLEVEKKLRYAADNDVRLNQLHTKQQIMHMNDAVQSMMNRYVEETTDHVSHQISIYNQRLSFACNRLQWLTHHLSYQKKQHAVDIDQAVKQVERIHQQKHDELNREIQQWKQQYQSKNDKLLELEHQSLVKNDEMRELKEQIGKVEKKYSELSSASHQAMQDVASQHKSSIMTMEKQINEVKNELSHLKQQYDLLQQEYELHMKESEVLKSRLNEEKDSHQKEVKDFLLQIADLQKQLITLQQTSTSTRTAPSLPKQTQSQAQQSAPLPTAHHFRIPSARFTLSHALQPSLTSAPSSSTSGITPAFDNVLQQKLASLASLSNSLLSHNTTDSTTNTPTNETAQ